MALGGTYSTGSVDVTNGSATVPGNGVLWVDVIEGDWLIVGTAVGVIDSVSENLDEITLKDGWAGETAAAAGYRILKMSWLRYDPALTQAKLRQFIANIEAAGIFLFVAGAAPDPSMGEEGQYALKVNAPNEPWRIWFKQDGQWIDQGNPVGFSFRTDVNDGNWDVATKYTMRDLVRHNGKLWFAKRTSTGVEPGTSAADWVLFYPFPNEAGISIVLDAQGSEIAIGPAGDIPISFRAKIRKVSVIADGIGDLVLDLRKKPIDQGAPEAADSICAAAKPTLAGARVYTDSELTGWVTDLEIDDVLQPYVESCDGITRITVTLHVERVWNAL